MAKGWSMPREQCPYCGKRIAANWVIWHIFSREGIRRGANIKSIDT